MKTLLSITLSAFCFSLCQAQELPNIPVPTGSRITAIEYFFDRDPGPLRRNHTEFSDPVDRDTLTIAPSTDKLHPGAHTLYIRLRDEAESWGHLVKHPFFVFPKFQATHLEWRISEADQLLASGIETLDPSSPQTQSTIQSQVALAASEPRDMFLEARLILDNRFPATWKEYRFLVTIVARTPDQDTDGDGIVDRAETGTGVYVSPDDTGTNPELADSDGDSIPDGEEIGSPLDPNVDDSAIIQFLANRSRTVNLPAPTLTRNENGQFEMRLTLEASQDLNEWFQLMFNDTNISTEDGQIKVQLPSENQSIQFYHLQLSP